MGQTRGTETSKYPEEEKTISDSRSSGERGGNSPNRYSYGYAGVVGLAYGNRHELEAIWKDPPKRVIVP